MELLGNVTTYMRRGGNGRREGAGICKLMLFGTMGDGAAEARQVAGKVWGRGEVPDKPTSLCHSQKSKDLRTPNYPTPSSPLSPGCSPTSYRPNPAGCAAVWWLCNDACSRAVVRDAARIAIKRTYRTAVGRLRAPPLSSLSTRPPQPATRR